MKHTSKRPRFIARNRRSSSLGSFFRHASIESLESRQLLSITLPALADQTVLAGAPLHIALNGSESSGHAVGYNISWSNVNLTGGTASDLGAAISTTNPSLKLVVSDPVNGISGELVFQLFQDLAPDTVDHIMSLVADGYYDGVTFHRVIEDFMIQGGDPDGDGINNLGYNIDDEFSAALQFTGSGILAMANTGNNDTNGSQFFITVAPFRSGDFNYTIFGFLTEGADLLQAISQVDTNPENDKPLNDVTIVSASIFQDTQNGVLRLSAAQGVAGTADVTVTAYDDLTGETVSQTFTVTFQPDTVNDPPFLEKIDAITLTENTSITVNIGAVDVEGDAIQYAVYCGYTDLNVTINSTTGALTIAPDEGLAGVFSLTVGVKSAGAASWGDTQTIPVYINPAAPTGVALAPASDTGTSHADGLTSLNNASGATLQFIVSGVQSGATVRLYADGVLIGQAVASSNSVTVTTDGTTLLTDGTHAITATQTLEDQEVEAGNLETTVDLVGAPSAALSITVDTTAPVLNFTPVETAVVGEAYSCQVSATDAHPGLVYALTQSPAGMSIHSTTGQISWTPAGSAASTSVPVTVRVTDAAGHTAEQSFSIAVSPSTHGASISGYVYIDANNDGLRAVSNGQYHIGIQGAVVELLKAGEGDAWTHVQYALTAADGSYAFTHLAAGTYRIVQTQPAGYVDGIDALGTVNGTKVGAAGNDVFSNIVLSDGAAAVDYNFGERGLAFSRLSAKYFLASSAAAYYSASAATALAQEHNQAPIVRLGGASSTDASVSYAPGGAAVAIAPRATIADADGAMLVGLIARITNRQDGESEVLAAATADTPITAAYSNGALTLSGAATVAEYQQVLRTVTYADTASSPTAANRTIEVTVNDGISASLPAALTVTFA